MQTRSKGPVQSPTVPPPPTPSPPPATRRNQPGQSESDVNKDLEELYTNIKSTPSYGAKIKSFLQKYKLHSRNKRITKKIFPRRRVIARFKDDLWQADLIEYESIKYQNNGYQFILLVIDVFSKVIYVEALKRKTGEETSMAIDRILQRAESPVMLVTDGGREFFNSKFFNVMISHNINHFRTPTKTPWKASVAERAVRTIKTKIDRWMQHSNKKKWITVYQQIVDNYNKTPHSAHKLAPLDVTKENRKIVYKRLYPKSMIKIVCRLKIGDKVRKLRQKREHEKGYTPSWSEEIYTISAVRQTHAVCWYILKDSTGKDLDGIWYYHQLNLIARDDSRPSSE